MTYPNRKFKQGDLVVFTANRSTLELRGEIGWSFIKIKKGKSVVHYAVYEIHEKHSLYIDIAEKNIKLIEPFREILKNAIK